MMFLLWSLKQISSPRFVYFNTLTSFQYMIVLVIIFIILFSISIAALSISASQEEIILDNGWKHLSSKTKADIQKLGECCGFQDVNATGHLGHPSCVKVNISLLAISVLRSWLDRSTVNCGFILLEQVG